MRKHLALIATLIPFFVAAPVAAHHMAEGIVADDIYAMIDENPLRIVRISSWT